MIDESAVPGTETKRKDTFNAIRRLRQRDGSVKSCLSSCTGSTSKYLQTKKLLIAVFSGKIYTSIGTHSKMVIVSPVIPL